MTTAEALSLADAVQAAIFALARLERVAADLGKSDMADAAASAMESINATARAERA